MFSIVITRPGGPEVLELRDVPTPTPGAGEVLVRVRTAALNRADLLQREGRYPAPPGVVADVPGLEFAGEVAALGPGARGTHEWREGDRVFGIVGGGAQAEYLVAHGRTLARVPDSLDWVQAAAVPEAFVTAHDALVTQAAVRASEAVLVHAVASGVGLAAVQLARAASAVPYGTTRTAAKLEAARAHGLEAGVALADDLAPLAESVSRWTGGRGIDVALDLVGGPYAAASIAAMAPRGRVVLIGTVAGARAELSIRDVMGRRLTIRGTVLRARPLEEKIAATLAFAREVVPLLARGTVRPTVDATFAIERIADAHRRLASNETVGKVVLTLG
jgi:putative PIG3 family NAD(P)H quinone oxidoreductase